MTTLQLDTSECFAVNFSVKISDKYTNDVHIQVSHTTDATKTNNVAEMFLSVDQLDTLASFLTEQANIIRSCRTKALHTS